MFMMVLSSVLHLIKIGADDGVRSHNLLHGKQVLYQLNYIRINLERVRGIEPRSLAWKAMALPLSYTRIIFIYKEWEPKFPSLLLTAFQYLQQIVPEGTTVVGISQLPNSDAVHQCFDQSFLRLPLTF